MSQCLADSECTEKPLGFCGVVPSPEFVNTYACQYGCIADADCGPGFLCQCGDPVGTCQPANCQTDADCGDGLLCARGTRNTASSCYLSYEFFCETPQDECRLDTDCPETPFGSSCAITDGARVCAANDGLICGRPFLVEGSARLASVVRSGDWRSECARPECNALSTEERSALASAWSELGLMEHASVAAFARFTLQLLGVGAPAALVEQSQRALADELLHARLCFSLASDYAGEALGPGPLPTEHALDLSALEDIVALTLHEGCVGETVAALEASEALAVATDPAVRQVLARIEADERRHAELAWRFVSWALGTGGMSVQRRIERELGQLLAETATPRPAVEQSFDGSAHGILPAQHRAALRDAALRDVVLPCARALLPATRPATCSGSGRSQQSAAT
ncbi:MAG: hypothetical protein RL033_6810 [Pseudomonadota bacterium]|jgi:hypothetical protein